jgi:hypothetical protein
MYLFCVLMMYTKKLSKCYPELAIVQQNILVFIVLITTDTQQLHHRAARQFFDLAEGVWCDCMIWQL